MPWSETSSRPSPGSADDLARLRSPRLKEDLWAEARDTKNEVIERTKEAAKDGMPDIVTDLKGRAAANPVAALAIGAGLSALTATRPSPRY